MTTTTLPERDIDTTDHNDKPFHFVRKDKITESIVLGTYVEALCGKVFQVTRAHKPGQRVCEECKQVYERMYKAP